MMTWERARARRAEGWDRLRGLIDSVDYIFHLQEAVQRVTGLRQEWAPATRQLRVGGWRIKHGGRPRAVTPVDVSSGPCKAGDETALDRIRLSVNRPLSHLSAWKHQHGRRLLAA